MNKNSSRTLKEWSELAKKELKGSESDSLIWKTPEGIDIQPIYTENDLEADAENFLNSMNINPFVFNMDNKIIHITKREKQCLKLLNQGHSIKTIANELSLSPRTVETHLKNIKNKTGLYNKPALIQLYRNFL